jgi:pimeloyl-ACP methyl ester carboxylesterase
MWWLLAQIFLYTVFGLALIVYAGFLAGRWFLVERYPDEIHFASTDDGWRIALTRYRARKPNAAAEPVLLCHGIASNRFNMDLGENLSLAEALANAGHDTWIVELRGRGLSTQPRLFGKHSYDWCFDEYVERDLPAAIDAVLTATGRPRLHFVGFSLGAVMGYAVLETPRLAEKVATAVAIAGPASFRFQAKYLFSWPLRNLRSLRHRFLMRLFAPVAGYWSPQLLFNPENVSGKVVRRYMVNAAENFGSNEMLQLGDWIQNDVLRSIDHRKDYRKDLGKITTPILFVAGNKDRIAPPPAVKDAHDAVASTDKQLVIVSRGQSFSANYGHFDLLIGDGSAKDVYPLVVEWIDAHRSGSVELPPVATSASS